MYDALLPGVIRLLMVIIAEQAFTCSVGGSGDNRLPGRAFDNSGMKMIQGDQESPPSGGRGCASRYAFQVSLASAVVSIFSIS